MKFNFGNIVVVDGDQIGVIVKSWVSGLKDRIKHHDVYVRSLNRVLSYPENEIKHFIFSKELHEDEHDFYNR